MNLDELLKVNSVRCIKTKVDEDLVEGETYRVEGFNDEAIKIVDRNAYSSWHNKNLFEPVPNNDMSKSNAEIDISLNNVNDNINMNELVKHLTVGKNWKEIGCNHVVTITEISSEFADSTMVAFESDCCVSCSPLEMFLKDFTPVINNDLSKYDSEIDIISNSVDGFNTTFKVGDKVYCPSMLDGTIYTVKVNSKYPNNGCKLFVTNDHEDCYDFDECGSNQYNNPIVYHATEENHKALQVLHSDIKFELPPKEITGSDLCRAMLDKGWHLVPCVVSDISDSDALNNDNCCLVDEWCVGYFESDGYRYKYAVPFDPKTGIPLTEDVLNETI